MATKLPVFIHVPNAMGDTVGWISRFSKWVVLLSFLAGGAASAAPDKEVQEVVKKRVAWNEQQLSSRGVNLSIEVDVNALDQYKSWREPTEATTAEDRADRAKTLINQVGSGLYELARNDELRDAMVKDLKRVRIVHDDRLAEQATCEVRDGVATFSFNYQKFAVSNTMKTLRVVAEQALPSAAEAARNKQRKEVEKRLALATDYFRKTELLDVQFEVRWAEFDRQDAKVLRGLEQFATESQNALAAISGFASGKTVVGRKLRKVSLGLLKGAGSPVVARMEGQTLYVALPVDTLNTDWFSGSLRQRFQEVLGIQKLEN